MRGFRASKDRAFRRDGEVSISRLSARKFNYRHFSERDPQFNINSSIVVFSYKMHTMGINMEIGANILCFPILWQEFTYCA
jgi:hypothetical protein